MTREVFIIATAYLLGCFCTGYYLVRLLKGLDIRALFSGNVGSRNVGRLLGAKGFVVTLTGDGISLFARAMTPLSSYRFGDSAGWMELFPELRIGAGLSWQHNRRCAGINRQRLHCP